MTEVLDEPRYRLNRNRGVDTLHTDRPFEECNVDDALDREWVDAMTAEAMLLRGDAVRCKHCDPQPVG